MQTHKLYVDGLVFYENLEVTFLDDNHVQVPVDTEDLEKIKNAERLVIYNDPYNVYRRLIFKTVIDKGEVAMVTFKGLALGT